MNLKPKFIVAIIIVLAILAIVFYRLLDRNETSPALHTPTPTMKPGATASPLPLLTDAQKQQAWKAYQTDPKYGCKKAEHLPPDTLALRFSMILEGKTVTIPVEREDAYECKENLFV